MAVAGPTPARSPIDSNFFFASSVDSLAGSSVASLTRFLGSIDTPQHYDISTQSDWIWRWCEYINFEVKFCVI
ncbi:hypothetical protein [[Eubacterium] cellulosolvens]